MKNAMVMKMVLIGWLAVVGSSAFAQTKHAEEGRRYIVRGTAAMEMAKTQEDIAEAAKEFRKAAQIAPEMAIAWFNLGVVEAKLNRYAKAADAYRRYLQLSPEAEDAAKIRSEIIKLDYLHERFAIKSKLAGSWVVMADESTGQSPEDTYRIRFDDDKFIMEPLSRAWLVREVSLYTNKRERDRENSFKAGGAQLIFMGRVVGDRIVGERIRPDTTVSFNEEKPNCMLREYRSPFEARLADNGAVLNISFSEPRNNVYWDYLGSFLALGTSKYCRAIETAPSVSYVLNLQKQQQESSSGEVEQAVVTAGRPKSVQDYMVRGAMALSAAKSDRDLLVAEAEFKKATEVDPRHAEAWYNLGLLYVKLKKYPDAIVAYQNYLEIMPSAENASQVGDEITRLQYFQERQPEPAQPGWTFLAEKTAGDRGGDKVYYDKSTIRSQNGIASVTLLWDFATPPRGGWDFWSVKEVYEINCGIRQGRRVSFESFDGHMGQGKRLHQSAKPDQTFISGETQGTLGQIFIDAVCH